MQQEEHLDLRGWRGGGGVKRGNGTAFAAAPTTTDRETMSRGKGESLPTDSTNSGHRSNGAALFPGRRDQHCPPPLPPGRGCRPWGAVHHGQSCRAAMGGGGGALLSLLSSGLNKARDLSCRSHSLPLQDPFPFSYPSSGCSLIVLYPSLRPTKQLSTDRSRESTVAVSCRMPHFPSRAVGGC